MPMGLPRNHPGLTEKGISPALLATYLTFRPFQGREREYLEKLMKTIHQTNFVQRLEDKVKEVTTQVDLSLLLGILPLMSSSS